MKSLSLILRIVAILAAVAAVALFFISKGKLAEKHTALEQMSSRSTNYKSMSIDCSGDGSSGNTQIKAANRQYRVRPEVARFPLCITWTPLPALTQLVPVIGHTGIACSKGVIHDFAGPYYISVDDFAFGETHKYV